MRKRTQAKELAQGLANVVQSGRMLKAFLNTSVRLKIGKELDQEVQKAYEAYLEDPTNQQKFE